MTESSLEEKSEPPKKVAWQTVTVVLVLAAFVIGGVIFSEWGEFAGPVAAPDAIAVLSFENTGQDSYGANLADNLTESISNTLEQNSTLHIVSRVDILRYKGKGLDANELGKVLKARMVLSGRLLRQGDDLIINVTLLDVGKKAQVWTKQYNVAIADVTKLPEEISREVIAAAGPQK